MSIAAAIIGTVFVLLWIWLIVDLVLHEEEWRADYEELEEEFWNKNT